MRTNRYINSLVALVVTALLVFVSCQDEDKVTPTIISLDENVISLVKGTSQTLIPHIEPPASASGIVWSSSNPEIVLVNEQGLVQAIELGKAVINAKIGNSTSFCDVYVTDKEVPVRGIVLNKIVMEMRVGDVEKLSTDLVPVDATNRKKRWTSSNENIVSVHEVNGTVTAHSYGKAVITVTTLDGGYTATCTIEVLPVIELFTPSEDNITLRPAELGRKVEFTWNEIEGIEEYILKVSTTDRFASDDIIYTATTRDNKLAVSEYDLNEAILSIPGSLARLFWTIESGTAGIRVLPATGHLNLIPDRRGFLLLVPGSATGMNLQKKEDAYHYSIATTGAATVNTVALKTNLHADSAVVSMMYKSNRALTAATVRFVKAGGVVQGTVQQDIPAAPGWTEWRVLQEKLPEGWGNAGDYLQFDFGSAAGYDIEVNAIRMTNLTLAEQKAMYTPEILLVESSNNDVQVIEKRDNYFKFKVLARDPVLSITPFTKDLPTNAVVVSFEYKSDKTADHCQIFLLPLRQDLGYPNTWGAAIPANDTGEWKEHRVNISTTRAAQQWWGKAGPSVRIDPGGDATIGMTMEIRNIKVVFAD